MRGVIDGMNSAQKLVAVRLDAYAKSIDDSTAASSSVRVRGADVVEVFKIASIIGMEVPQVQLVEIVDQMGFGGMRSKRVVRAVDKVIDEHKNMNPLLTRGGAKEERFGTPQVVYRFSSVMARDAVYGTMVKGQTTAIHAKVSRWYKTQESRGVLDGHKYSA